MTRTLAVVWLVIVSVAAAQESRSVWDGVYSAAQAERGAAVYADRCASCHAPDLSGIGQAAPLTGADFLVGWVDLTAKDLFERIHVSMPADQPRSLTPQQVADVMAFILQKNDVPAGQTDLPTAEDALKAVKIIKKP